MHTESDRNFSAFWGPTPTLAASSFEDLIKEWTSERVRALYSAPVAEIELTLWREKEQAERVFRETPDSSGKVLLYHWVLE
jgi:hypothetical protein